MLKKNYIIHNKLLKENSDHLKLLEKIISIIKKKKYILEWYEMFEKIDFLEGAPTIFIFLSVYAKGIMVLNKIFDRTTYQNLKKENIFCESTQFGEHVGMPNFYTLCKERKFIFKLLKKYPDIKKCISENSLCKINKQAKLKNTSSFLYLCLDNKLQTLEQIFSHKKNYELITKDALCSFSFACFNHNIIWNLTALFVLCLTERGLEFIENILKVNSEIITENALFTTYNVKNWKYDELSVFYLLTKEKRRIELLLKINRNKILFNKISINVLCNVITNNFTSHDYNRSPIYNLLSSNIGLKFLFSYKPRYTSKPLLLLVKNKNTSEKVSGLFFATYHFWRLHTCCDDNLLNEKNFLENMILYLLTSDSDLLSNALCSPASINNHHNVTPLFLLSLHDAGLQIMKSILTKIDKFCNFITNKTLYLNTKFKHKIAQNTLFEQLIQTKIGWEIIEILYKNKPNLFEIIQSNSFLGTKKFTDKLLRSILLTKNCTLLTKMLNNNELLVTNLKSNNTLVLYLYNQYPKLTIDLNLKPSKYNFKENFPIYLQKFISDNSYADIIEMNKFVLNDIVNNNYDLAFNANLTSTLIADIRYNFNLLYRNILESTKSNPLNQFFNSDPHRLQSRLIFKNLLFFEGVMSKNSKLIVFIKANAENFNEIKCKELIIDICINNVYNKFAKISDLEINQNFLNDICSILLSKTNSKVQNSKYLNDFCKKVCQDIVIQHEEFANSSENKSFFDQFCFDVAKMCSSDSFEYLTFICSHFRVEKNKQKFKLHKKTMAYIQALSQKEQTIYYDNDLHMIFTQNFPLICFFNDDSLNYCYYDKNNQLKHVSVENKIFDYFSDITALFKNNQIANKTLFKFVLITSLKYRCDGKKLVPIYTQKIITYSNKNILNYCGRDLSFKKEDEEKLENYLEFKYYYLNQRSSIIDRDINKKQAQAKLTQNIDVLKNLETEREKGKAEALKLYSNEIKKQWLKLNFNHISKKDFAFHQVKHIKLYKPAVTNIFKYVKRKNNQLSKNNYDLREKASYKVVEIKNLKYKNITNDDDDFDEKFDSGFYLPTKFKNVKSFNAI